MHRAGGIIGLAPVLGLPGGQQQTRQQVLLWSLAGLQLGAAAWALAAYAFQVCGSI